MAELLQSDSVEPPDDVPRADVAAGMKRPLNLVAKVAVAAAFVVFVEYCRWMRRRNRTDRLVLSPPARLRVRQGADRRRVTFAIEGTLDQFAARMLACRVGQLPRPATTIVDLSAAGPIQGEALAIFARLFAAGRQVRLRGLSELHGGLLTLGPVLSG